MLEGHCAHTLGLHAKGQDSHKCYKAPHWSTGHHAMPWASVLLCGAPCWAMWAPCPRLGIRYPSTYLEGASLEQGDLIVLREGLEAGNVLGELDDLSDGRGEAEGEILPDLLHRAPAAAGQVAVHGAGLRAMAQLSLAPRGSPGPAAAARPRRLLRLAAKNTPGMGSRSPRELTGRTSLVLRGQGQPRIGGSG